MALIVIINNSRNSSSNSTKKSNIIRVVAEQLASLVSNSNKNKAIIAIV
jgi:hypothetical protein